jgi:hypothetical protein
MVEKVRNHVPTDWTYSMVAYDEDTHEGANLAKPLVLGDALRDLPPIKNSERRDVVPYTGKPDCEFQLQVRRPPPGTAHLLFYPYEILRTARFESQL